MKLDSRKSFLTCGIQMKFNILVVDDEYAGRNTLQMLLCAHVGEFVNKICVAGTLEEAKAILAIQKIDLVFLDIQLQTNSGFELVPYLPEATKIVYVTAYSEHALKAIKNRAFDYILKPVDPVELTLCLQQCAQQFKQVPNQYLSIKIKGNTVPIELSSILYIKAKGPYAEINDLAGKVYITSQTLKTLETKLNTQFIRVHKSYIINRNFIKSFNQKELFLNERCIPLSRNGLLLLQEYYSS